MGKKKGSAATLPLENVKARALQPARKFIALPSLTTQNKCMKKNQKVWPGRRRLKKIFLIMNFLTAFLLCALLQVSAAGFGQQRFTLHYEQVAVEKLFERMESGSNFRFLYNDKALKEKMVSLNVTNATLEEIMDNYLPGLQYKVMDNGLVVIAPREEILRDNKLKGKVVNEQGQALPGVSIRIKGTTMGAVTGADGSFELQVPADATLVFTYIGFLSREIKYTGQESLTVALTQDNGGLNEVVVVGYGTQKREQITTAVASVKAKDFVKGAAQDAGALIRGKVAGLSVTTPDGNPAGATQVNLRGISTIMAAVSPLVLIDGIPGSLNTVAPEDIESIDVLKDGSAAAIYGTRGTNGVILITTKQVNGEMPPTLDINTYATTQHITKRLPFMNAAQYRQLVAEGRPNTKDYGYNTNWLDLVTQTPFSAVYNVSVKGGNRNTSYIANLNYRDLNGIMKRSNQKLITPRLEVNHSMFDGKLKFNGNLTGYQQTYFSGADGASNLNSNTSFRGDVYRNALTYNPTDRPRDSAGNWVEHVEKTEYMNPVSLLEETQGQNKTTDFRMYGTVSLFPVSGLAVRLLGSRDILNTNRGYYETKKQYSTVHDSRNGFASRGAGRKQDDQLELTATYDKVIRDHQFTVLGGYSWRYYDEEDYYMQNWDFPADNFTWNSMQTGLALKRGEAVENSYQTDNKLVSFFGRVNYAFKDKYLLMASIRREASSKFGENYKWGNFPAVSVGWNIKKESFLEASKVVSVLKLRGGYGITGTEPSQSYASLKLLDFNTYYYQNGVWKQSINQSSNPNPDLRWEKKEEGNVGIDFGLFKNVISGSIDLYKRTTRDLLFNYPVPTPPYLYGSILANAAVMQNKGIEIQVNAIPVQTKHFSWNTSVNFSANKNLLVSLSNDAFSIASGYFDAGPTSEPIQQNFTRIQIGQPIGNFWGFKTTGIDDNGHWIIQGKDGKDKSIDDQQADDKQVIGNGMPKRYLAFNNSFAYKNLDLNITMRGAFGFQIVNAPAMWYATPVSLGRGNVFTSTYAPVYGKRAVADDQSLNYVSYFIENGNYWKIDNITLGYNILLKNKYLKRVRVYVSGGNLITFTKYSGIDPEISTAFGGNALVPGIDDRNRYPATSTYTLGAFLSF